PFPYPYRGGLCMNALVVRRTSDGGLVCFGPENGMYAPVVDPATMTMTSESYETVKAEWKASQPIAIDRVTAKESLKNARTLADLIAALQTLL
ncbi:MAG: hypothetical protein ABT940_15015, partial [Alphaproteobacteria bacterium]